MKRELSSLRSEKTIVLAILIQLFVAAFSSFLVVGLVSLYDPGAGSGDIEVTVGVSGDAGDDFIAVADAESLRTTQYPSHELAMREFKAGRVDAVVNAQRTDAGRTEVVAVAPRQGLQSTLVVVQIRDALSAYERAERTRLDHRIERTPLPLPPDAGANPYFGFTYTVLLPLLMFLPVFISGSVVVDSITEELERGTFELLRVTSLSTAHIVDGKFTAMAALAPAQAGTWLALLALNGTAVDRPGSILALVVGFTLFVVSIGVAIAFWLQDRERAQLVYSLAIIFVFTATYFLPENPPNAVAKLAIGSADASTTLAVVFCVVAGSFAFVGFRKSVGNVAR